MGLRTEYGKLDPKEVLNINAFDLDRILDFEPDFLEDDGDHQHDTTVSSVAVKVQANVNMAILESWIQRLIGQDGANLYRYKGVLAVKGMNKKFVFQGVGMLFTGDFQGEWKEPENEPRVDSSLSAKTWITNFYGKDSWRAVLPTRSGSPSVPPSKPTSEALSRESSSNTGTKEMPTVSNSKTDARPMSGHPSTWTGTFVLPNKTKKHKRKEKTKTSFGTMIHIQQWH